MKSDKKVIKGIEKVNKLLLSIETFFLASITIFLVAAIFIEVVCRYFLFISVAWAEEITRYLFVWLTYIGSAYALYGGAHTEIDVIKQAINKSAGTNKEKLSRLVHFFSIVGTTTFLVIFGKIFYVYMMKIWARTQTSPTMHIPMGLIYLPVFIGIVLSVIHEICMLAEFFCQEPTSAETNEN